MPDPGGRHGLGCNFCSVHTGRLRDLDTGQIWCIVCAIQLIDIGDPVLCFEEFDGDSYALTLARRGYKRRHEREPPD